MFYFAKQEPQDIAQSLARFVRLKLVKEAALSQFDRAAYGLGFRVSTLLPPRFQLVAATFDGAAPVASYSQEEIQEALAELGTRSQTSVQRIEEFPGQEA